MYIPTSITLLIGVSIYGFLSLCLLVKSNKCKMLYIGKYMFNMAIYYVTKKENECININNIQPNC